jgi:hypothetical protein
VGRRDAFVLGLVAASTVGNSTASLSVGLCVESETTFFACQTAIKQWVSLCGVLPNYFQYRFGNSNRTEFSYPMVSNESRAAFRIAHYSRYQTERYEIAFSHRGIDYVLFEYTETHGRRAGVRVIGADLTARELLCVDQIHSRLNELGKVLNCDVENALNAGTCP